MCWHKSWDCWHYGQYMIFTIYKLIYMLRRYFGTWAGHSPDCNLVSLICLMTGKNPSAAPPVWKISIHYAKCLPHWCAEPCASLHGVRTGLLTAPNSVHKNSWLIYWVSIRKYFCSPFFIYLKNFVTFLATWKCFWLFKGIPQILLTFLACLAIFLHILD